MSIKSNKCACGLSTFDFSHGITSIKNTVNELYVHEPYKLSPDLIRIHIQVADGTLKNLEDMSSNCDIDTKPERERLISLRNKLSQMNDPNKLHEIRNDASLIADGVRVKLLECKRRVDGLKI